MWQKLKEQIPAIIITSAFVIAAGVLMVKTIVQRQQSDVATLRAQNESLQAQAEENRQQIAATNKLLKDALAQQNGALLQPDSQIEKINEERLTRLAEVIAQRVVPAIPVPKSAAELEASQNDQVDKVADRLAQNIRPVLAGAIAEQQAATTELARDSHNRIAQLNVGLLATQAAAQDALRLSREISSLYANSARDEGVLMRLFSLPASLVIDAAHGNVVQGQQAKTQRELSAKMEEIEKRLKEVQSLATASN